MADAARTGRLGFVREIVSRSSIKNRILGLRAGEKPGRVGAAKLLLFREETMAVLSFNGCANIGLRLIKAFYPDAFLWEVDGTASPPSTDPRGLTSMRVVCSDGHNGTVIVRTTRWGEFGPPEYFRQPWVEDVKINWPVPMDLPEATEIVQGAGYKSPFGFVTLREPLYPFYREPLFIFAFAGIGYVGVGTYSRRVYPMSAAAVAAAATLSFDGFVNIAIREAREIFPEAQLLIAQGGLSKGRGNKAADVDELTVTLDGGRPNGPTLILRSLAWGQFGPPIVRPGRLDGARIIPWPDSVKLDLPAAVEILYGKAGFNGLFTSVTLAWHLAPSMTEPYYIFDAAPSLETIGIGATNGKIVKAT
jgi:hypothetical protein